MDREDVLCEYIQSVESLVTRKFTFVSLKNIVTQTVLY